MTGFTNTLSFRILTHTELPIDVGIRNLTFQYSRFLGHLYENRLDSLEMTFERLICLKADKEDKS